MTNFTYEALNVEQAVISGQISAESASDAVNQLETQGLQVLSIHKADPPLSADQTLTSTPAAGQSELSGDQQVLHEKVAEVLAKRDVFVPALSAFAEELPDGRTRRELRDLVSRMQADTTAADFCGADGRSASWLLLLGRGTNSQHLLSDLFDEATRENENNSQWNRAFAYPAFVLLASLTVLIFLCISVVPTFTNIFDDFQLDLPTATAGVVAVSKAILRSPEGFALGIIAALFGAYASLRFIRVWGLPGQLGGLLTTGSSAQVTAMAGLTRRLAETLDAGLKLPAAMRLAAKAERRRATRQTAMRLADALEQENFELEKSTEARRLPTTVVHALQAGPNKQPSIALLRQLSELYSIRVRNRHNWSTGYMTHFAIVAVGITVGFVVLALFLPLVGLINGLAG